jgi:hypothetical protein
VESFIRIHCLQNIETTFFKVRAHVLSDEETHPQQLEIVCCSHGLLTAWPIRVS